jgi:hypothetical protein
MSADHGEYSFFSIDLPAVVVAAAFIVLIRLDDGNIAQFLNLKISILLLKLCANRDARIQNLKLGSYYVALSLYLPSSRPFRVHFNQIANDLPSRVFSWGNPGEVLKVNIFAFTPR